MFEPGQLVVCVDDSDPLGRAVDLMDGLKRGAVYTVRWSGMASSHFNPTTPAVRLKEIYRSPCPVTGEVDLPFAASRFRPLDDSKLSIFREMLAPSPDVIAEYVMEDDTARIDAAAEAITRSISG